MPTVTENYNQYNAEKKKADTQNEAFGGLPISGFRRLDWTFR